MINSEKLTINDVCDFIGGSQPPKTNFSNELRDGYIRFVQTRDFKTDSFITYIPKHLTTKFFVKSDIMIGRYGPPIFQIFRGMEGAYNVALLKAKPKKNILNDYLYYFLLQKSIFEYVDKLSARTGGQTGVDLFSLYKYPINLPSIETQQTIAKVLSDLDSKIELNNKINTELEAMAKTLYHYWFVQFDFPDANGKPYKTSGGKMVWNEELKREIPEYWESGQLGDVGKVSMCKRIMKSETSSHEEIPFFKISTFGGDANTYISKDLFELYREKYSYPKRGDILISAAGTIGKIVIFDGKPSYFQDSNIVWIDNDESKIPNCFLFYFYQTEPWLATGGSTIKRLYNDNIRNIKTIFPNSEILKQFSKIINPHLEKKHQIECENKKIASLRDWLLPMLMNGQVSVGEVSKDYDVDEDVLGMVAEPEEKLLPKVVKLKPTNTEIYKRTLLAAEIVYQLKDTNTLGHLKLQKMLYLCQEIGSMNLPMNFLKQAMGPYDNQLARSLDKQFVLKKWFEYQNGALLKYKPLENCGKHKDDFLKFFENEIEQINYLINKFTKFTSNQIEAVATLYACWKEAIEQKELITDKLIITKFYQWSKEKEKFREENLIKALAWMRRNGVEPR